MQNSAKRLSSLLSLGSISSDKSTSSAPPQSTSEPLHVETGSPPPILLRSPTADVRASASTPDLCSTAQDRPPSATLSPLPSRPSSGIGDPYPFSPDDLKPPPHRIDERISRPSSRASSQASSRPTSPSFQFRPLTTTQKDRALTPTHEGRPTRRRSWIPGRQRVEALNGSAGPNTSSTWFLNSQEKIPYDATPLVSFYRVSPLLWRKRSLDSLR